MRELEQSCGPLFARHALRHVSRVAVVGCGYMGLLFIQGLRGYLTKHILAVDVDANRLELTEEFGANSLLANGRSATGSW